MVADKELNAILVEIGIQANDFKGQMAEISRRMGMAKAEIMAAGGIRRTVCTKNVQDLLGSALDAVRVFKTTSTPQPSQPMVERTLRRLT